MSLTIDGTNVQTLAFNVVARTRGQWPAARGSANSVPGRHGVLPILGQHYDVGQLMISMFIIGANTDGTMPTNVSLQQQVVTYAEMLQRLLMVRHRLLDVRQDMPDSSIRQCYAQLSNAVNYTSMAGATRAELAAELVIPSTFWQDVDTSTYSSPLVAGDNDISIGYLTSATAPITDLVFTITGPATNPRVTDPISGTWIQVDKGLVAGDSLVIDSSAYTITLNGASVLSSMERGIQASLFELAPRQDGGAPHIVVNTPTASSSTTISVVGRRKFITAQ